METQSSQYRPSSTSGRYVSGVQPTGPIREDIIPCEVQIGILLDKSTVFPDHIKPDDWSRAVDFLYTCDEDTKLSIGASHIVGFVDPDSAGEEMFFSRHRYRGGILLMLCNDGVYEPFPTEKLSHDAAMWFIKRQPYWRSLYGTRAVQ